jgi:hypothetical protein
MIVEPDIIHKNYIKLAKIFNWRFYKILSKNQNLIQSINNGKFFYFGSTFLSNLNDIDINKKRYGIINSISAKPTSRS